MKTSLATRTAIVLVACSAFFILLSYLAGKDDIATELPYDIGIALLIVAGIELGLSRWFATTDRSNAIDDEIRAIRRKMEEDLAVPGRIPEDINHIRREADEKIRALEERRRRQW